MKAPRLKREWIGRKVRTVRMLRNGMMVIPAGTVCTVTYNRGGLTLDSVPCPHCGVRISISKVPEHDVVLLEEA